MMYSRACLDRDRTADGLKALLKLLVLHSSEHFGGGAGP